MTLSIRLPKDIDKRLTQLAKRTHRTKTFYACEAIVNYLEELEDTYDALKALKDPGATYSIADVAKELQLSDEEEKDIGLGD